MSSSYPVLVVHGVNNRDRLAFEDQVSRLKSDLGLACRLLPVFWGDLGASVEGIEATLPQVSLRPVRSEAGPLSLPFATDLLAGQPATLLTRTEMGWETVAAETVRTIQKSVVVRSAGQAEEIRQAICDEWPRTRLLQGVANKELLAEIGRAVAEGLEEERGETTLLVRGVGGGLRRQTVAVLRAIDRAVGAAMAVTFGNLNQFLRQGFGPGFGRFLGDVLVYEGRRQEIQARLWEALQPFPECGTEQHPVIVIAHSLGGVISFHAATEGQPKLWIRHLITFGSQSAFFHLLRPEGGLPPYQPNHPVELPTIGQWTNLWEPLDPLAFLAGKVFRLRGGTAPVDLQVQHRASQNLWTHSVYWTAPLLIEKIREALA